MAQIDNEIAEDLGMSLALLEVLLSMAERELDCGIESTSRTAHLEHERYWTVVQTETQAILDKYQHVRASTLAAALAEDSAS